MVVGGGIGGIILLIIALIFGINPGQLPTDPGGGGLDQGQVQPGGSQDATRSRECKTGADANRNDQCRVIATVNSVNAFWAAELPRYRREYTPAKTDPLQRQHPVGVRHGEQPGRAVLLPARQAGLHRRELLRDPRAAVRLQQRAARAGVRRGARVRPLPPGPARPARPGAAGPQGPESGAVRIELMADCLGGVWAHHAATTKDEASGTTLPQAADRQGHQGRAVGGVLRR